MANTVGNVTTGIPQANGGVYRAPAGTTLPTDAETALANDYVSMGYISEDGLTNSNSAEIDTGKDWAGEVVITFQTEKPDTFQFTMIESTNVDVLKAVYGEDNVTGDLTNGITVDATADEAEEAVWVFDIAERDGKMKRIVVPKGKVTEVGDIVYKNDEITGYEITLQAFPFTGKQTHKEYIAQ